MCNTGLSTGLSFPAMNLSHAAAAAAATHRGFGVHVSAASPLTAGSYAQSFHQRNPFAIQELLGLSAQDHAVRSSGLTGHPTDGVLPSGYIPRTLPPTAQGTNCLGVSDPTMAGGHSFPSWRPNFMSFSSPHAQSMLNLGAAAAHGLSSVHPESSGGQ